MDVSRLALGGCSYVCSVGDVDVLVIGDTVPLLRELDVVGVRLVVWVFFSSVLMVGRWYRSRLPEPSGSGDSNLSSAKLEDVHDGLEGSGGVVDIVGVLRFWEVVGSFASVLHQ